MARVAGRNLQGSDGVLSRSGSVGIFRTEMATLDSERPAKRKTSWHWMRPACPSICSALLLADGRRGSFASNEGRKEGFTVSYLVLDVLVLAANDEPSDCRRQLGRAKTVARSRHKAA